MSRDEINRLLAEKVMGWRWVAIPDLGNTWRHYENEVGEPALAGKGMDWNPYDNIAQAMMVADKVIAMGYAFTLNYFRVGGWRAFFEDGSSAYRSDANAIPTLAICEAALKVVEND